MTDTKSETEVPREHVEEAVFCYADLRLVAGEAHGQVRAFPETLRDASGMTSDVANS